MASLTAVLDPSPCHEGEFARKGGQCHVPDAIDPERDNLGRGHEVVKDPGQGKGQEIEGAALASLHGIIVGTPDTFAGAEAVEKGTSVLRSSQRRNPRQGRSVRTAPGIQALPAIGRRAKRMSIFGATGVPAEPVSSNRTASSLPSRSVSSAVCLSQLGEMSPSAPLNRATTGGTLPFRTPQGRARQSARLRRRNRCCISRPSDRATSDERPKKARYRDQTRRICGWLDPQDTQPQVEPRVLLGQRASGGTDFPKERRSPIPAGPRHPGFPGRLRCCGCAPLNRCRSS